MDGPLAHSDSITYGINYRSPLNDIPYYHVANSQLPQDIMHVILEGVLSMETKLMLYTFTSNKKLFTIDFLNERIMSSPMAKLKQETSLQNHLRQITFHPEGVDYLYQVQNYLSSA